MTSARQPAPADIGYILATLRYRWRWIALPVVVFAACGLLAPLYMGESYVSKATLLVEPPRVSGGGSEAVLTEEIETLRLVEHYALSDAVLTDLATGLGALDERPEDLRERVDITTSGGPARGAPGAPVTVEISFTGPTAELSKRASSEIVAFVLSEHATRRAGLASGTLAHFSREESRLAATLAAAEGGLREFERQNQASLPESLSFRRKQRGDLRAQMMQIERDIADLKAALVGLATGASTTPGPIAPEQLVKLRSDRAALAAVLSQSNPRLAALDAQISALEGVPGSNTSPDADLVAPRAELQSRLTSLTVQREALAAEVDALSRTIEETPRIASELSALQRVLRTAERNYEMAQDRKSAAEASAQIEHMNADGRIAVLHPAMLPEFPDGTGRTTLAVLGAAFGFFSGLFLMFVREMFDTTIRRPADLRVALDLDPFAVIPILSPQERRGLGPLNPRFGRPN